MDILSNFGISVREFRKRQYLSQEELAERAGLDRTYVGGVERGERNISLLNISKIAEALDIEIADLFSEIRVK